MIGSSNQPAPTCKPKLDSRLPRGELHREDNNDDVLDLSHSETQRSSRGPLAPLARARDRHVFNAELPFHTEVPATYRIEVEPRDEEQDSTEHNRSSNHMGGVILLRVVV